MMKERSLSIKQYGAMDIQRILGISRNKLFFWTRTKNLVKPDIREVRGTGRGNLFSFKNLLDIALIKNLDDAGYELNAIQWFILPGDYLIVDPELYEKQKSLHNTYKHKKVDRIWDFIKEHKDFYYKHGCIFLVSGEKTEGVYFINDKAGEEIVIEEKFARLKRSIIIKEELFKIIGKGTPNLELKDMYLIDLLRMIGDLEDKADDKL